jgi:hypothetical protein
MQEKQKPNKQLRGQPFIGETVTFKEDPDSPVERICRDCLYNMVEDQMSIDCELDGVKEEFGIKATEQMPITIDGEQVGHYCSHWVYILSP